MSTSVETLPTLRARARWDPRAWSWWVQTVTVYLISRLWLVVVFDQVSLRQPANGWTGARPSYFSYVALLFDGTWYRKVAEHGYPSTLPIGSTGHVAQNPWAFFPGFPYLVKAVMALTGGTWVVVAPLVATVLGGAAMLVIHRVVQHGAPRAVAAWPGLPLATVAVVCAFPTSGVLQAAYSESLALLLIATSLLLVVRRRYEWAALAIVALGLSRAVALPMTAVVVAHGLTRWWSARAGREVFPSRDVARVMGLTAVSVVSGFLWIWICALVTGRSDGYFQTQEAWRAARSTTPFYAWTYAPQFWFGRWTVAVIVFLILLAVLLLAVPSARRLGTELYVWGGAYPVYIAAAIEPGTSIGRFMLLAFPIGATTVGLVRRPAWARWAWLGLLLGVMMIGQALWTYKIWLFTPPADWPP